MIVVAAVAIGKVKNVVAEKVDAKRARYLVR